MNNNSSSFAGEEENLSHAVYDTALFDVLKVDAEDFAVRDQFVCPPSQSPSSAVNPCFSLVANHTDGSVGVQINHAGCKFVVLVDPINEMFVVFRS